MTKFIYQNDDQNWWCCPCGSYLDWIIDYTYDRTYTTKSGSPVKNDTHSVRDYDYNVTFGIREEDGDVRVSAVTGSCGDTYEEEDYNETWTYDTFQEIPPETRPLPSWVVSYTPTVSSRTTLSETYEIVDGKVRATCVETVQAYSQAWSYDPDPTPSPPNDGDLQYYLWTLDSTTVTTHIYDITYSGTGTTPNTTAATVSTTVGGNFPAILWDDYGHGMGLGTTTVITDTPSLYVYDKDYAPTITDTSTLYSSEVYDATFTVNR